MEICELKDSDEKAWDEYVLKHPDSTFYHQIGWKNVVEKSYGHKPYYLLVKEEGEIQGIFPLFLMKSMLFGRKLVSVPFAPYGGVMANSISIEYILVDYGIKIAKNENADYVELRYMKQTHLELPTNNKYVSMILKLDNDPELIWKRFNNKVRNSVRNSLKSELEFCKGNTEDLYNLYSKNMRYLGTPTHSKLFFDNVMSYFGGKTNVLVVKHKDEPVAAIILLCFKDIMISGWAASNRDYLRLNPNNLLYWNAIKLACEKGYNFFDFGRSIEGSGTYRFKKPWGAVAQHLQYSYYLNTSNEIPDTSQGNHKREIFAKVWKKMPLSITCSLGPLLRKKIA